MKVCSKCKVHKELNEYSKHPNTKDGLQSNCRECGRKSTREWGAKNKERRNEYTKVYKKNKRQSNPFEKLKFNVRSRTNFAFTNKGFKKDSKTNVLLGCTWEELKQHLEKQFAKGMTWDNYGEWHIDHIKPISLCNNINDLLEVCHYTNLQPLWAEDNLSKGNTF